MRGLEQMPGTVLCNAARPSAASTCREGPGQDAECMAGCNSTAGLKVGARPSSFMLTLGLQLGS